MKHRQAFAGKGDSARHVILRRMLATIALGLTLATNTPAAGWQAAAPEPIEVGIGMGYLGEKYKANLVEPGVRADVFQSVQANSQPIDGPPVDERSPATNDDIVRFARLKIVDQGNGQVLAAFKSHDRNPSERQQLGLTGDAVYQTWILTLTATRCNEAPKLPNNTEFRWDGFAKAPARFIGRMRLSCGQARRLMQKFPAQITRSVRLDVDRGTAIEPLEVTLADYSDKQKRLQWLTALKRHPLKAVGRMTPGLLLEQ